MKIINMSRVAVKPSSCQQCSRLNRIFLLKWISSLKPYLMWFWSKKMERGLAEKCLAFCQALMSSNNMFTLNISVGKDTFNFCNKVWNKSSMHVKKKKSPSQLWRETRRRLEKKHMEESEATEQVTDKSTMHNQVVSNSEELKLFECSKCDLKFKCWTKKTQSPLDYRFKI